LTAKKLGFQTDTEISATGACYKSSTFSWLSCVPIWFR